MAHIGTTLEIFDQMTAPLQSITNSLYTTMGAFEGMQDVANNQFDYSNFDGVRSELDDVTKSILQMRNNLQQGMDPVEIPVEVEVPAVNPVQDFISKWDGTTVEVFTTTGADRAASEMDAFNRSIERVKANQSTLFDSVQQLNIETNLDDVNQDFHNVMDSMNGVRDRLEGIASMAGKIPDLDLDIGTQNNMLESVRQNMAQIEQQQNELNQAVQRMDVQAANQAYKKLNTTISGTERYLRDNIESQDQFNSEIRAGTSNANDLVRTLGRAAAAYVSIQSLGSIISLSDELTQSTARLNLMNDASQTTAELQNKIFEAAERSRGSYLDMIGTVASLGQRASDAFSSNDETIAFAENLNKQFIIAGASQEEVSSATLQLTQALGSGVLRGEELNAVLEAAPNIVQSIADYMDAPIGQIREMASEGQITAEIVKNSMLSATDTINAELESMPLTFAQIWTSFQNQAMMAFQPVLQRLNDVANSDAFQNLVSGAINAVVFLAAVVAEAFNVMASLGQFVADHWSIIAPLVYGVATAMAIYYGYVVATKTAEMISAGVKMVSALASFALAAATGKAASATAEATAAQHGWNTALLGSPITWVIIAIIALIAVTYAVVAAINHFTGTSISATGIIAGAFAWLGMLIWNIFIFLINAVIGIAEWFVNVWNLGVWLVQMAFIGLLTLILLIFDGILNIAISAAELLVNAWNFGVWLVQMAFIGLLAVILLIFDAILNIGIIAAELLANAWNFGIWAIHVMFQGLKLVALAVLDGILNFGISTAEFFSNAWNKGVFGVQSAFYHMQVFISKIMQAVGSGALGIVNTVLSGISSLINTAVGGLNKLISMANKVPGINISTIGTVDFQVGSGAQAAIDSIGANITAPVMPEQVQFERSNLAGEYAGNMKTPDMPDAISLDRSNLAGDFLGNTKIPAMPEYQSFDRTSLAKDFLSNTKLPEFPELVIFDKLEYGDMGNAFDKGYEWGENLADNVKGFDLMDFLGLKGDDEEDPTQAYQDLLDSIGDIPSFDELGGIPGADELGDAASGSGGANDPLGKDIGDIADNTSDMKDAMDLSAEDLQYLRDIAARDAINKHTVAKVDVHIDGIHNNINNEMDLDGVVDYIVAGAEAGMEKAANGVHD